MSPLKEINAIFVESNKLINFLYSSMYTPPLTSFTLRERAVIVNFTRSTGVGLRIGRTICHPHGTGRCFAIAENQPN